MRYFLAGLLIISAASHLTNCVGSSNMDHLYPESTIVIKYQDDYQYSEFHKRVKDFKSDPIGFNKIVFMGNSITYGLRRWDNKLEAHNLVNRGISGDFSEGIQKRLDEIIYYKPIAVFILIGINDFFRDSTVSVYVTPSYVAKNIISAAEKIKKGTPKTKIYLQTILPINTAHNLLSRPEDIRHYYYYLNDEYSPSLNQQIIETNKIIKDNDLFDVIDLHSIFLDSENELDLKYSHDGLHLNETGYNYWMKKIKPLIDKLDK
tara:strand:- start:1342 stop:2127 length:786 start_codon:yes stop_codon:yes gene_type:complete